MKDNKTKKEMQTQYKEREIIGGVYIIKNTLKNKLFLDAAIDLQSSKNRFEFAQKTGSGVHMKLQQDWAEQGSSQFVFQVLEELKKSENQTAEEFNADIGLLKEMWLEKLSEENLY